MKRQITPIRFVIAFLVLGPILCLYGCRDSKRLDPIPSTSVIDIPSATKEVNQLAVVLLVAKGENFGFDQFSGKIGGRSVALFPRQDTLVFIMPDISAGNQTLSFSINEKAYNANYIIKSTNIGNIESILSQYINSIKYRINILEQSRRISIYSEKDILSDEEIESLKDSFEKFSENVSKANPSERAELAKFITANPFMIEELGNLRMNQESKYSNRFLAAVQALVSAQGLKAILFGSLGYIIAAGGLGPAGFLIGAGLMIYAVVTIKNAMMKVIEISQIAAIDSGVEAQFWRERVLVRELNEGESYRFVIKNRLRTIGKQDTSDPTLSELFELNDKMVYVSGLLKSLKLISGNIVNLRNINSEETEITIPAKDVSVVLSDNKNVSFQKSEPHKDTIVLKFFLKSNVSFSFSIDFSFKNEDNKVLTKSEYMILKKEENISLNIVPSYVNNYKLKGEESENILFKIEEELSPVVWTIPYYTVKGNIQKFGYIDDNGVFSSNEFMQSNLQVIGEIRVKGSVGSREGIAKINITTCILEVGISSYAAIYKIPVDYEKVISGDGIGKLIDLKWGSHEHYTLRFEYSPKVGENVININNPFPVPIGVTFYKIPDNMKSEIKTGRIEVESKSTRKLVGQLYGLEYD